MTSGGRKPSPTDTQAGEFGWQGITAQTPADWELTAFGGDAVRGHAYLDDGEQICLRIRWDRPGRLTGLDAAVRRYRRAVRRESNIEMIFEEQDATTYPKRFRMNKDVRAFCWNDGEAALGVAWRCHECDRLVIADVVAPTTAHKRRVGQATLATIMDHGLWEDAWRWSVYGFAFHAPSIYDLEQAELQSGRLRFAFRGPSRTWIRVERWGMAAHTLKKAALDQWPTELLRIAKVRSTGNLTCDPIDWQGHRAYRFSVLSAQQGMRQLVSPPTPVEGLIWHDADRDKVLAVLACGSAASETLRDVAPTVHCQT